MYLPMYTVIVLAWPCIHDPCAHLIRPPVYDRVIFHAINYALLQCCDSGLSFPTWTKYSFAITDQLIFHEAGGGGVSRETRVRVRESSIRYLGI